MQKKVIAFAQNEQIEKLEKISEDNDITFRGSTRDLKRNLVCFDCLEEGRLRRRKYKSFQI